MKKLNRHKILSAACIAALPLLVVACLEFDGIIQPGRALTDSEIEVTAQLRVSPGEDGSGKVVFAVLAPKAWNLRDNATLYLTTKDYNAIQNQPEVVNEQLTLMPAEEKDPKNGLSWADSFMSVIGRGGNDPRRQWSGSYGVRRPHSYSTTRSKWTDRKSRPPTCMPTSGSE